MTAVIMTGALQPGTHMNGVPFRRRNNEQAHDGNCKLYRNDDCRNGMYRSNLCFMRVCECACGNNPRIMRHTGYLQKAHNDTWMD